MGSLYLYLFTYQLRNSTLFEVSRLLLKADMRRGGVSIMQQQQALVTQTAQHSE